jgi:hypothetical protein
LGAQRRAGIWSRAVRTTSELSLIPGQMCYWVNETSDVWRTGDRVNHVEEVDKGCEPL